MIEGFVQDHVGQGFLLAPLLVPFKTTILVKNYINVVSRFAYRRFCTGCSTKGLSITPFTEGFN